MVPAYLLICFVASAMAAFSNLEFDVQGSVHLKYIRFDLFPTRCNFTQFIYFWKTALYVSDGIFAHHQEQL